MLRLMSSTLSLKDNDSDVCQTGQACSRPDKIAIHRTKVAWPLRYSIRKAYKRLLALEQMYLTCST